MGFIIDGGYAITVDAEHANFRDQVIDDVYFAVAYH